MRVSTAVGMCALRYLTFQSIPEAAALAMSTPDSHCFLSCVMRIGDLLRDSHTTVLLPYVESGVSGGFSAILILISVLAPPAPEKTETPIFQEIRS